MSATTYLANKALEHFVGKTSFTLPSVWVGVYTANPTAAGTQTNEANYTGYARVATTGATWGTASAGAINNVAAIGFGAKTAGTDQTLTHWATFDAATAGNMLNFGPLAVSQLITNGTTPSIPIANAPQSMI